MRVLKYSLQHTIMFNIAATTILTFLNAYILYTAQGIVHNNLLLMWNVDTAYMHVQNPSIYIKLHTLNFAVNTIACLYYNYI